MALTRPFAVIDPGGANSPGEADVTDGPVVGAAGDPEPVLTGLGDGDGSPG